MPPVSGLSFMLKITCMFCSVDKPLHQQSDKFSSTGPLLLNSGKCRITMVDAWCSKTITTNFCVLMLYDFSSM